MRRLLAMLLAVTAAAFGCQSVLGIHDVDKDPASSASGSGGSTSSTSTGSTGGGGQGGSTGAPTTPVLRSPLNGTYVGNVHVPGSMRPTFGWDASMGTGTIVYAVEYSKDPTFAGATQAMSSTTTFQPAADIPVSMVPPVGDRIYWHVRACVGSACSAYSPARWLRVGRTLKDVNGDGYDDLLVGNPDDSGGPNMLLFKIGAVRAYWGGPGMKLDGTADSVVYGPMAEEGYRMAVSIATADVNGDGYADLITGGDGLNTRGLVHVFFGGPTGFKDAPDLTIPRPTNKYDDGFFGFSVANAGDVDGDGYTDIIVGAYGITAANPNAGEAYVFLGGPTFDGTAYTELSGVTPGDQFGYHVASAGDVDGDGLDDVIIGAPKVGGAGAFYIYLGVQGGVSPAPAAEIKLAGSTQLGLVVTSAGDVNGDGLSDVIATDPLGNKAYLFFGAAKGMLAAMPDVTFAPPGTGVGSSAISFGDVNGDGYADVGIGIPQDGDAGRVAVFLGGVPFDTVQDGSLTQVVPSGGMGFIVGAGDYNGDGLIDIVSPRDQGSTQLQVVMSGGKSYPLGIQNAQGSFNSPGASCFN